VEPRRSLMPADHEPVVGALFEAYERAGMVITQDMVQMLRATAPPLTFFETD